MKRVLFAAFAVAVSLSALHAEASVFSNLLNYDGTQDVITDDSVGIFVEKGTVDGILEVGDLIQGLISFDPIGGNSVPVGSSVIGIYSFEVTDIGVGGSTIELGATTTAGVGDVVSLMASLGVDVSGLAGTHAGLGAIAVLDTTAGTINRTNFTNTSGFDITGPVAFSDFDAQLVGGFDGVDDHHSITSFGGDLSDLSVVAGLAGLGIPIAGFNATYSVVDHAMGPSTVFLPIVNPLSGATGDVTILNGFLGSTNTDTVGKGLAFNDDGDFNINAVPEPGSMLVWSSLMGLGFLGRRRKQRQAKK